MNETFTHVAPYGSVLFLLARRQHADANDESRQKAVGEHFHRASILMNAESSALQSRGI